MTNTQKFAKQELDILVATVPDAVIAPFSKEILALCESFGKSVQSGVSAPYTATALANAIKKLLLHEPICDITGHESEWNEVFSVNESKDITCKQNLRCHALFLNTKHYVSGDVSIAEYLYAIVWKGKEQYDTFTGKVYADDIDFELISSNQFVKSFPFKPKTFYVDVVRVLITKEDAEKRKIHYIEDTFGDCYYTVVKDKNQLTKVFKYYDKKRT